ncbi:MAG: branched-chain amino acid transport system substrate-binding protein [Desulfovibrionales bacterium]|jgi:branched-chain amino acid transport system substrate-binding protein|nr:branched-chain amino acid transport system substrate-binding protein [Desulfovibrionales bacterium]
MKRFILAVLALALVAVAGCDSGPKEALKVGSMSPLTGPYAADGNDIANGVRTAIEVTQQAGGLPGFESIQLIAEDTACDPRQAVAAANKLINEGVVAVVGAYCSSSTIPASETLDQEGVVMITPASTNEKVTERGLKNMFRTCGRDDDQSIAAIKFMTDYLKAKTLFIIDDKTTYSQGLADSVEKKAAAAGIDVLGHEHVNQGDKDFSAVLTKAKEANPDVLYMSMQNSATGSLLIIQARRMGLKCAAIGQDAVYHPQFIEIAKDAAEGVYLTFGYIDKDKPAYKKFLDAYTAKYGEPGAYSAYAYDSAMALFEAIKMAKGKTDAATISANLKQLTMEGASKKMDYLENGDSGSNYIIRKVENGQFINFWDPQTGKVFEK